MELVQRRAAAEGESSGRAGIPKELDKRPTDHEILLDLRVDGPRRVGAPSRHVPAGLIASGLSRAIEDERAEACRIEEQVGGAPE